jgi:hypothetical protein
MATCMLRVIITFICKLQVGDLGCREAIRDTNALKLPRRIIMFLGGCSSSVTWDGLNEVGFGVECFEFLIFVTS